MIVCVCNNISEREIHQAVGLGVTSIAELRDDLGVATCCGECLTCAKQVLGEALEGAVTMQIIQPLRGLEACKAAA